ncbi:MAG: hypothetical protein AAB539_00850 [Patescibacteria group bacterium]
MKTKILILFAIVLFLALGLASVDFLRVRDTEIESSRPSPSVLSSEQNVTEQSTSSTTVTAPHEPAPVMSSDTPTTLPSVLQPPKVFAPPPPPPLRLAPPPPSLTPSQPSSLPEPPPPPPPQPSNGDVTPTSSTVTASPPREPQEVIIHIYSNTRTQPANVTLYVRDTLTFINDDDALHWPGSDPHPTHSSLPQFDALGGISNGQTYSYTFRKPGAYGYHEHLMDDPPTYGVITVLP